MTIQLLSTSDPMNAVIKNTEIIGTAEGTLREPTDVLNPVILFPFVSDTVPQFNYVFIPGFHRYYFVTDYRVESNGLIRIALHVDVLGTYWDAIKDNPCVIARNQWARNNDLVDNEIWFTADSLLSMYPIPFNSTTNSIFTTAPEKHCVLVVQGAG